jgi:nucleoside-diphosphate-sugar epimerase
MPAEPYQILYCRAHGIRATSLRLSNAYSRGTRCATIINWFVRLAVEGREITLFGYGTQVRDANHVDDVVEALLLAGMDDASTGEVFNHGGETPHACGHRQPIRSRADGCFSRRRFAEDEAGVGCGRERHLGDTI